MNLAGARIAREVAGDRFVAGSVGPLNVTLSLSPKVDDPAFRTHTFDQVKEAYAEQMRGARRGRRRPAAARDGLRHAQREGRDRGGARDGPAAAALDLGDDRRPLRPHALGPDDRGVLGLGRARRPADRRRQLLARRARDALVRRRPRARRAVPGQRAPERRAAECVRRLRRDARGDEHAARRVRAGRAAERRRELLRLRPRPHGGDRRCRSRGWRRGCRRSRRTAPWSGLEPFEIGPDTGFVLIGERTNVTGSARFRRLVEAGDFAGAVEVALEQVRGGANALDVNMDADLLESEEAMRTFLNVIATEPEVARLP